VEGMAVVMLAATEVDTEAMFTAAAQVLMAA
jgi:hypothetical protein